MSQPTTYEQLIARKLQDLSAPEQADAIWSTIEHQLNIEMPVNGSGSGGLDNPGWWIGGGSLFTIFVAALTYIFVSKQNLETERNLNETPAPTHYQQPIKTTKDSTSQSLLPLKTRSKQPEAASPAGEIKEELRDSSSTISIPQSLPAPAVIQDAATSLPPADSVVTRKKPRGVRGINDADYRLVPAPKNNKKSNDQPE